MTTHNPATQANSETPAETSLVAGEPMFQDQTIAALAEHEGNAAAWKAAFTQHGAAAPAGVSGDFSVALVLPDGAAQMAVDRFAVRSLCYRIEGGRLLYAERAVDLVGANPEIDPQALFDYLHFHVIPSPRTIFKGVFRLPPAHRATFRDGLLELAPYWVPAFVESRAASFGSLRDEFRQSLADSVRRQLDGKRTGCFLSGGTDSSTVAGMLGQVTGAPAQTFSIGFDAEGYDEMEFSRIAARHFGAEHHEYYITPADLVESVPKVAASYDQPFGNSSVLPAYYCAKVAREAGIERMLGGDGGDELFGGNSRYAKQRVFGVYDQLPDLLRNGVLQPLLGDNPLARALPGVRKAASYVNQARVPMPDRMHTYNLLQRLGIDTVLTADFLAQVDIGEPLAHQRAVYANCTAKSLVNRMLAYDWRYTLAETDIPKVVGATALAGVSVGFPLLDQQLVDFSMRLPPHYKVNRLKLRWFFKEALRGFLPDQIITKKKQGFGLPFGVWATRDAALMALARDSLGSLGTRGLVRADFLAALIEHHLPEHPGYYGEMVWILMMLEQWLQAHAPNYRVA